MKKIIVTGGAGGIGYAIAKEFKNNGYQVYTLDLKPLKENQTIHHYQVDINDLEKIKAILKEIGAVDIIVNNAAIQTIAPFLSTSKKDIKDVLTTNLIGTIIFTKEALSILNKGGQIINIGSVHSSKTRKDKLAYDVSKAGLETFTKTLALELAPHYRVNQINMGAVMTPMNEILNIDKHLYEETKSRVPLDYIFESEDVAKVVYHMSTDDFKYLTGTILVYDAGRSLT